MMVKHRSTESHCGYNLLFADVFCYAMQVVLASCLVEILFGSSSLTLIQKGKLSFSVFGIFITSGIPS